MTDDIVCMSCPAGYPGVATFGIALEWCSRDRRFFPTGWGSLPHRDIVDVLLLLARAGHVHLLGDVHIHVQGEGRGGMAQVGLHGLDVYPGADGYNGICMTQIVVAHIQR